MNIEKIVLEYRKTKDKDLFNIIVSHYMPLFKSNVKKHYGKSYDKEVDNVFESLIIYYFDNDLKDKLSGYLYKKSKNIFNLPYKFNILIRTDEIKIKKHYVDKMYNMLMKETKTVVLLKSELYNLVKFDIDNMFKNYLRSEKTSAVSNYFNALINRKIKTYKNEEKLILSYVKHIGVNNRIQTYFYKKYFYIYKLYEINSTDLYKEYIDDILLNHNFNINSVDFESLLIKKYKKNKNEKTERINNEIKNLKEGKPFNYNLLKNYYFYIKKIVFDKYKDKVFVSEEELKSYIDKKYDSYFNAGIEYIKQKPEKSLARYINNRLSGIIKRNKRFFKPFYVDENEKQKTIKENTSIIHKLLKKYNNLYDDEVLLEIIKRLYYENAELFYTKERKAEFKEFVRSHINADLKEISNCDDNAKVKKT